MFLSQIWPAKIEAFNSWYLSLDGCRELWQTKNSICGKRWPGNMLDCIEFLPAFLHFSMEWFVYLCTSYNLPSLQQLSYFRRLFRAEVGFWIIWIHPKLRRGIVFSKKNNSDVCFANCTPNPKVFQRNFHQKKYGWTFFAKAEKVFFFFASSKDMFDVFRCHFLRHFPKTLNCSSKGFLFHQNHKSVMILGKTSTLWVTHPTPTCFSMFPQWLQSLCVCPTVFEKKRREPMANWKQNG